MSDILRLTRLCDDHCVDAQATVEAPCDICGLERQLAETQAKAERARCVYCNFGDDDAPGGPKTVGELQAHVEVCEYHPLAAARASAVANGKDRDTLRDKLAQAREAFRHIVCQHPRYAQQTAEQALTALDAGSVPLVPLQQLQEWAVAYAALASGHTAEESNQLELAFNAASERLWEALDAGKESVACQCDAIHEAMIDGHPNPEGAEEFREYHGHYAGCPAYRKKKEAGG